VFGLPSPGNSSIGNPLNLNWSIPINDPDGDALSWTIECNNGQTNSGTGASNGIKLLPLSDLVYSTTYKVWVNATDPTGSGQYTENGTHSLQINSLISNHQPQPTVQSITL